MKIRLAVLFLVLLPNVQGEVRLPQFFSSHMVLQRAMPIHLWGWSDPDEKISVAFQNVTRAAASDRLGRWDVYLPPQPAGGTFRMTVTGSNTIVLDDVLIGDVWFASGQSNMEMPLGGFPGAVIKNSAAEIAQATHPDMRLLLIDKKASAYPLEDVGSKLTWTLCTPETAAKFSAVAYFFGRDIAQQEHVPIGLIDSSWGGTPAEAWISLNGIASDASLMPIFAARATMIDEQTTLPAEIAAEKREDAAALSKNLPAPSHTWRPDLASWDPSWLFNGMVAPFTGFGLKGVIWYQGESNADAERAPLYQKVFSTLIADWRRVWQQGEFPFLFVQIANFDAGPDSEWPLVREAQRRTLALTNTGMAVTIDVGNPKNIHPADKQTVGARLALAARAIAYHEDVPYKGPSFRQTSGEENGLRVWFDHAAGLTAKAGSPQGFEIAGADHRFVKANAQIVGETVLVSNSDVSAPKYVRYGWTSAPTASLYNAADLPASPFTSEPDLPVK